MTSPQPPPAGDDGAKSRSECSEKDEGGIEIIFFAKSLLQGAFLVTKEKNVDLLGPRQCHSHPSGGPGQDASSSLSFHRLTGRLPSEAAGVGPVVAQAPMSRKLSTGEALVSH